MNVGDLLDSRVVGPDGAELGFVVDVRLALELLDEPDDDAGSGEDREVSEHDAPLSAQARRESVGRADVVGVLVSPRRAGSYHGYERTDVRSPWPVPQLVRRRHRGTFLVRWQEVADVGADAGGARLVRLVPGFARLSPELR